jgi:predicted NBD/HSP70 family sugar kinase/biotin operon repressor
LSTPGRRASPLKVDLGHGHSSEQLRPHNLSMVLRYLHLAGPLSRSDLTQRTELSRSTVATLVAELAERGLVVEGPPRGRAGRGRPSPEVRLAERGPVALAVEIAVDSLAVAVVGLGGQVRRQVRVDRRREPVSAADVVAEVQRLGRPLLVAPPVQRLVGIGVSIVGVVRRDDGLVRIAPNLGWRDEPLGELVASAFDEPVPVHVGNDADLGALAEHQRGAGVGVDDFVFLYGEVGVGGGVILDGRPLRGADGYSGEIGHVTVNPDGRPCRCGSRGCLETEVGEPALLRAAGADPTRGGRESVDEVLRAAAAGDEGALRALREVGRWLGIGVAGIVNTFNPRRVVLGGYFARIHHHVESQIETALDARALPAPRASVEVVASHLGWEAPLLGAAELALAPLLADPTLVAPRAEG